MSLLKTTLLLCSLLILPSAAEAQQCFSGG